VIVVDNDSADGSRDAAAVAFPEFRVINSGANLGFGRANNLARGLVDTSLVLFLNPDTELMEGTLDRAVECFHGRPDVGAVGCRMFYPDGRVQELGLQWQITPWTALLELLLVSRRSRRYLRRWLPMVDPNRSADVRKLYGGFLMVRRDVLDAAGWFDERYFMYAEDADLSRTITSLGWKLHYCSESTIVHVTGGTTSVAPSTFSILMKQESVNRLIAKHQGPRAAFLHRVTVLVGGSLRLGLTYLAHVMAKARGNESSRARWESSSIKQQQLVLWAVGLRRATVPMSPSRSAAPTTQRPSTSL
jgi:GT2 family glycosyltransferase